MTSKLKFILIGTLIVASMAYLITTGIQATSMRYTKVAELEKVELSKYDNRVKVTGRAVPGSIKYQPNKPRLTLKVRDETEATVRVVYRGIKPDALRDRGGVIVEGRYDPEAEVVRAHTLLAKCPSRYNSKLNPSDASEY